PAPCSTGILKPMKLRSMAGRAILSEDEAIKTAIMTGITALFLATGTAHPAYAEPINPTDILVLDGDTIRVHSKQPNVVLFVFNPPEFVIAACQAETELGAKATNRLRELVRAGGLEFEYVRCSCREGTQGTSACNWKRDCGTLRANGKDVGAILIAEGLAVPFKCGVTGCPRMPRPWCQR